MTQDSRTKLAFGKSLRKFRLAAGISQEALADLAGIHRTYVGDVERGERNLSLINIVRLAAALNVRASRILQEMEKASAD